MVMLLSSAMRVLHCPSGRRIAIAGGGAGGSGTSRWGAAAALTTTTTTVRTSFSPPPTADPISFWHRRHLTTASRAFSSDRVGRPQRPRPLSFPALLTPSSPSASVSRLGSEAGGGDVPSWTYVPYDEQQQQRRKKSAVDSALRRRFSSSPDFRVPDKITVPPDAYTLSYARSSGPGGQNVNKLNTQAVLKFHVASASFLPEEVRHRMAQRESNKINSEGYLTLSSQEFRTQAQNRNSVVRKLEEAVRGAYPRPKVRKMRKGISRKAKERRKEDKKFRSNVKSNRRRVDF